MRRFLIWNLFLRYIYSYKVKGFYAFRNTFVDRSSKFNENVVLYPNTKIFNSFIGRGTYCAGSLIGNSEIGAFCSIGPNSRIGYLGIHPSNFISTHPAFYSTLKQSGFSFVENNYFEEFKTTFIGNDVWIGANCLVLDGVNIGNGAIIAAGAIVVEDVKAYSVVGGVPAKIIRMRFDNKQIELLEKIKWWDWSFCNLKRANKIFRSNDVEYLYEYWKHHLSENSIFDSK